MEHKLIFGGEKYLAFARSRIKAMRATGMSYASQKFILPDAEVHVRIAAEHSFIRIVGLGTAGYTTWRWGKNVELAPHDLTKGWGSVAADPAEEEWEHYLLSLDGHALVIADMDGIKVSCVNDSDPENLTVEEKLTLPAIPWPHGGEDRPLGWQVQASPVSCVGRSLFFLSYRTTAGQWEAVATMGRWVDPDGDIHETDSKWFVGVSDWVLYEFKTNEDGNTIGDSTGYTSFSAQGLSDLTVEVTKIVRDPMGGKTLEKVVCEIRPMELADQIDYIHTGRLDPSADPPYSHTILNDWASTEGRAYRKIANLICCPSSDGKFCRVFWSEAEGPARVTGGLTIKFYAADVTSKGELKNIDVLFTAKGTWDGLGVRWSSTPEYLHASFTGAASELINRGWYLGGVSVGRNSYIGGVRYDTGSAFGPGIPNQYVISSGIYALNYIPKGDTTPAKGHIRLAPLGGQNSGCRIDGNVMYDGRVSAAGTIGAVKLGMKTPFEENLEYTTSLTLDAPHDHAGQTTLYRKKK